MPARNVPIPRGSPHLLARKAVPRTTIRTVRARISRLLIRMTSLRSRGIRNRARSRMAATPPAALRSVKSTSGEWPASHSCSDGMRSIIGMAAMSWNRRMPKEIRPWPLSVSSRSAYTFSTIAVLERERRNPTNIATGASRPKIFRPITERTIVATTCAPPAQRTRRCIFPRFETAKSRPTVKRNRATPNSASVSTIRISVTSPAPEGPMKAPATRNAGTTERRNLLNSSATAVAIARTMDRSRRTRDRSVNGSPGGGLPGSVYQSGGRSVNRPPPGGRKIPLKFSRRNSEERIQRNGNACLPSPGRQLPAHPPKGSRAPRTVPRGSCLCPGGLAFSGLSRQNVPASASRRYSSSVIPRIPRYTSRLSDPGGRHPDFHRAGVPLIFQGGAASSSSP